MSTIQVIKYEKLLRPLVEAFRIKTFEEGNDALPIEKFDPDNLNGETWLAVVDGRIASLVVAEQDHYATKDPKVIRACRFHTLKKYRNQSLGAKFLLPKLIESARQQDYDCVYWTHDTKNRALNAIYQHKRIPTKHEHFKTDNIWQSIQMDKRWLFQVDPRSDLLQYVYYVDLKNSGYILNPIECVVWNDSKTKNT